MDIAEIEKLNLLILRTDMSRNQKVKWLTEFIDKRELQLLQTDVVGRSEQLVLFAEWLQYNGKYQLPESQAKTFLEQQ